MKNRGKYLSSRLPQMAVLATMLSSGGVAMVSGSGQAQAQAPRDGRIAYVLTHRNYAVYETDESVQCPNGLNLGPRESFAKRFPDDGTVRTVLETQLKLEGENWHSTSDKGPVPYQEPQGDISIGLNLDGQVSPNDFKSPEGEEGIDNQFYRVVGCTNNFMKAGSMRHFINVFMVQYNNNRWMFELTNVDDLTNDDDVTLTTYRGRDALLVDATGENYTPGGTQHIDERWGKEFVVQVKGKIVDGVLTSDPIDHIRIPSGSTFNTNGYEQFLGLQFKLAINAKTATGLLGGYMNLDKFRLWRNTTWSTHHQSYGQENASALYASMLRNADAYPDPETGVNTAISMANEVTFVQAYIMREPEKTKQRLSTADNEE